MNYFIEKQTLQQLLTWSHGQDQCDVYPYNYQGSRVDLIAFLNENRAPYKGRYYITSAMAPVSARVRGRRCKKDALPRAWMAFDMDGNLSEEDFAKAKAFFSQFNCIIYETASSKPNARRFRVILLTSRPVIEDEAKIIGELIQNASGFTGWDNSTHRSAQPIFLPPIGVDLIVFDGGVLSVDQALATVPPKPPKKLITRCFLPTVAENVFGWFAQHNMVLEVGSSMHKVVCPWGGQHTDGRLEAGLFEPSAENNLSWGFKCLHAHCESKSIRDIYKLMKGRK